MNERDIFTAACAISDLAARAQFLDGACADDGAMKLRVQALLLAHDHPDSLLDQPPIAPRDPESAKTCMVDCESGTAAEDAEALAFLDPPTRPDSIGRIGHYEVLQVLGRGGFGIVFRVFDDVLHRVVAVKMLSPQVAATSPARKRFLREARSSAQVRHENVVQVYEVGEQPLPYIAMEFIPGETLQQRLDRTGPIDVSEVVRIGRQIAEGLAAAHANDLIHRDIKPGNILIEGGAQRVKITDFGLARAADDASISQSGIVAGTPMFMAPEQAKGETLDQRADLFSIGSVLYAMTAGRPPFRANGTLAVLKRVAEDNPRPIREVIPETPQWLCDIISRLHAKKPEDRFQSARELADLLAECESQLGANAKVMDFSQAHSKNSPAVAKSGPWKWAVAALLIPIVALALTEIAGSTHLFRARRGFDSIPRDGSPQSTNVAGTEQAFGDPDRHAAEYALSLRGIVKVNDQEQEINAMADLPRDAFRLTAVAVHNSQVSDEGLANFSGCKSLTHLSLVVNTLDRWGPVTDKGLACFRDCKDLVSLTLDSSSVSGDGLANFSNCKNLQILDLSNSGVTDAGLVPLKDCKNLTHLSLSGTQITDTGLICFKGCTGLTHLDLGDTRVTDAGLANFKDCTALKILHLSGTRVTDAALSHLKDCNALTHLFLYNTQVTDAGLVHLKDCKRLIELNLWGTQVSDAGMICFKDCGDLISLNLGHTQVGDAGIAAFEGSKNLEVLDLAESQVSNVGLAQLENCKGLKVLYLGSSRITNAGLPRLQNFKELTTLNLWGTPVSDSGLADIARLKNLTILTLARTKVTAEGVKELVNALPNCAIQWDGPILEPNDGADRRAAEYVMSLGGVVEINRDAEIMTLARLPEKVSGRSFQLTRVNLSNNLEVTDAGLAAFKDCQNLNSLDLTGTPITDAGLAHLTMLTELKDLLLAKTKVTIEGVEELSKALPNCRITWDNGVIQARE